MVLPGRKGRSAEAARLQQQRMAPGLDGDPLLAPWWAESETLAKISSLPRNALCASAQSNVPRRTIPKPWSPPEKLAGGAAHSRRAGGQLAGRVATRKAVSVVFFFLARKYIPRICMSARGAGPRACGDAALLRRGSPLRRAYASAQIVPRMCASAQNLLRPRSILHAVYMRAG